MESWKTSVANAALPKIPQNVLPFAVDKPFIALAGCKSQSCRPFARLLLVADLKRRAVFRPGLAVIINPRCRDIGMTEPFLDLSDIGIVVESIRRRRRAQSVGTNLESEKRRILPYQLINTVGSDCFLPTAPTPIT